MGISPAVTEPTAKSSPSPASTPVPPPPASGDDAEMLSQHGARIHDSEFVPTGQFAGDDRTSSTSGSMSGSTAGVKVDGYDTFGRDELAKVLSYFDVGEIKKLDDFRRGSRKAPKLIFRSSRGRFLLKRRAKGTQDLEKVQFCHAIQEALTDKQFPLPHLIPVTESGTTMLLLDGNVYELFEFIPGQIYDQSLEATYDAGRILSTYHRLLEDFSSEHTPPTGSYHGAEAVEKGFDRVLRHLARKPDIASVCRFLLDSYRHARDSATDKGLDDWPKQVVHGDWHPGNMLFRQKRVVAVIDYDSARVLPRIIDAANGALQFSILGGGPDLGKWPEHLDQSRFKRFLRGYDQVNLLSEAELTATPWLMIEALIAEAVFPIAATGNFGKLEGGAFLDMVQRKVVWLQKESDRLIDLVKN